MKRPAVQLTCVRALGWLEAYLDGDLATVRSMRLEAHLATCVRCPEDLARARRVREALRGMPALSCPEAVVEAALARAEAGEVLPRLAGVAAERTGGACARAARMLEPYLDGELAIWQVARLEMHVDACPSCNAERAHAVRVHDALRALPQLICPDHVTAAVLDRVRVARDPWRRLREVADRFAALPAWRPAVAALGIAAVAIALAIVARQPQQPPSPSRAEVARAELEAKWVVAYLGEISRRTGSTVRDDVIGERVVAPMAQAVGAALQGEGAASTPTRHDSRPQQPRDAGDRRPESPRP